MLTTRYSLLATFAVLALIGSARAQQIVPVQHNSSTHVLYRPTAAQFRTANGLAIGTDVQAYDADLLSWAAVTRASGFDTFTATSSSANLAALLTDETGSAGGFVRATSPTLVTPTIGDAIATSVTGPAATELLLNGGSSGARITLGQGSSAGATVSLNGTGAFAVTTAGVGLKYTFFNSGLSSTDTLSYGVGKSATSGSALLFGWANNGGTPFGFVELYASSAPLALQRGGSNVLIGTTTDMSGSGGLKVAGTTASTSTTSGALIVGGGAGIAGRTSTLTLNVGGSNGTTIDLIASASATLDFGSIAAGATAELTITITGAATGDSVHAGPPAALEAGLMVSSYVSASNTVTIRLHNTTGSPIDPASATWRATVLSF